jgi:hypothetical protein
MPRNRLAGSPGGERCRGYIWPAPSLSRCEVCAVAGGY